MGVFEKAREKIPVIKFLVDFQKSVFYPIIFGIICVISSFCSVEVYLPLIWLLAAGVIFSALFTDDLKVFLVPFLMIYYAIGMDFEDSFVLTNGDIFARFELNALIHFIICGSLMAISLLVRMIWDRSILLPFKKRGAFLLGILCLDVVFLLNGIFSDRWIPMDLLYGALNAVVVTVTYLIFLGIFRSSKDAIPFLFKVMLCFGFMVFAQILILGCDLYAAGEFFYRDAEGQIVSVARDKIFLSWGLSTIIGAASVVAIPSAFYFASRCKASIAFIMSACVFLSVAFLINTRSALLCGIIIMLLCVIICCNVGEAKKINRIWTAIIAFIGVIVGVVLIIKLDMSAIIQEIASIFRLDTGSAGRIWLWESGLEDFIQFPVFGVGFAHGGNADGITYSNVYSNMYHNIFVEFMGSMGVIGVVAFFVHIGEIIKAIVSRFSLKKLLLMATPLLILSMSLFDNFFFYPNFQIVYTAFLVATEVYIEAKQ